MHKPESFQENETRDIIWDFKIQTNPSIPVRKKRTFHLVDFAVS